MFKKSDNHFKIYILIYFLANMLNSWILLSPVFNGYLISFEFSPLGFFNSFIADMAILSIFFFSGLLIFKKRNHFMLYLLFVTLGLNFFVFSIFMFMRFYSTIFTFSLDIFNNPGGGLVGPVILETISVFFLKFRFLYMLPCIVLTVYYIYFKRFFEDSELKVSLRTRILSLLNSILISCLTLFITLGLIGSRSESSLDIGLFTAKNGGLYSFYLEQLFGMRFKAPYPSDFEEELFEQYVDTFNKNKSEYVNFLDDKTYVRNDELTGILEGHNLFVIQLESYNNFFINKTINNIEVTPNLNKLVDEHYYFSNVMTTVGIGNTSDAEFSVLTGLFPNGDTSIYWDYNENMYDFAALPKMFNKYGYNTRSYHGNNGMFYNREIAHTKMLGFNKFFQKSDFTKEYPESLYPEYFYNTWVNDEQVLNWGLVDAIKSHNNEEKIFTYQVLLQPHTPYSSSDIGQFDWGNDINKSQLAYYLDNLKYNDKILGEFLEEAMYNLPNTLFVLYGDHGSGIFDEEIRELLEINNNIRLRDELNKIPVLFIDNSHKIHQAMPKDEFESIGTLAKSQRDVYRTIINLFGLYNDCSEIYGINMFSNEPSIIYESKNVDFKTNDFYSNFRNTGIYYLYNDLYDVNRIKNVEMVIGKHRNMNNYYLRKKATK